MKKTLKTTFNYGKQQTKVKKFVSELMRKKDISSIEIGNELIDMWVNPWTLCKIRTGKIKVILELMNKTKKYIR